MENKQENSKQEKLEELIVVLSPAQEIVSNIPLAGKVYLKVLKRKYQKLFPVYQNFIFK